jgi:hypothetical protein
MLAVLQLLSYHCFKFIDLEKIRTIVDEGRLVILLNGFQKKTQKTPRAYITIALRLKEEYFE